jgi:hypothetical protein
MKEGVTKFFCQNTLCDSERSRKPLHTLKAKLVGGNRC